MPEGHTIHKLARDLTRDLAGEVVRAISPQGRFEDGAACIDGATLQGAEAWGKHLLLDFPDAPVHVHLGLFGRFRRRRSPAPEPRGAVRLRLIGPKWTWDLSGPTACEVLVGRGWESIVDRLGADPLRADPDVEGALARIGASRRTIGELLLDQTIIAGIGNVYRAELLFLAGIHPQRRGAEVSEAELVDLWERSVVQLERGVKLGRIVTVDEKAPPRGERLWAYKRRICRRCDGRIRALMLGARKIWYCPTCQPRRPAARKRAVGSGRARA